MKIVLIRHGEPDYERDSLTEKGWKEAGLLADRLFAMDVKEFYTSPLGRAKDTAIPAMERLGRRAHELPWLREVSPLCWDVLPDDWVNDDRFYGLSEWSKPELLSSKGVGDSYKELVDFLDEFLAGKGYCRDGRGYLVKKANNDTYVFFCHFAISCEIIGHLVNISPMVLWHATAMAPSSVTILNTEERVKGRAIFRISMLGDISHLYVGNEPPSFAGRFCESYDNEDERH